MDTSIFGIRFESNASLSPSLDELRVFLELPKRPGGREQHGDDLAAYSMLLHDLASFKRRQQQGAAARDYRGKAFYGLLEHSQFINTGLQQAVAQYKYHLHELTTLDFKKPSSFIKLAEQELGVLNPKKKNDAVKAVRLREMVAARKRELDSLKRQRAALIEELTLIALYIKGNLLKIGMRCRTAIVRFVEFLIAREEEGRAIEDVRELFTEQLRAAQQRGPVSKEEREAAKKDFQLLAKNISDLIRDDVYAMTALFEVICYHVREFAWQIDTRMAEYERSGRPVVMEQEAMLARLETVLVALISDFHFELNTRTIHSETAHENILQEKRNEMLSRLLEVLRRERRKRTERRGEDRRKFTDPKFTGPQRRIGRIRGTKKGRGG